MAKCAISQVSSEVGFRIEKQLDAPNNRGSLPPGAFLEFACSVSPITPIISVDITRQPLFRKLQSCNHIPHDLCNALDAAYMPYLTAETLRVGNDSDEIRPKWLNAKVVFKLILAFVAHGENLPFKIKRIIANR